MLLIILYLLVPRTFFPFTIPSRASFSRQFLFSQWPSQFLFLFFISPALFFLLPLFLVQLHFLFCLLHIHISNVFSQFCSFRCSVQVSAPYNATLHTKHFTSLFRSSFLRSAENSSFPVKSFFCHCYPLLYFLTAVQVAADIAP